VALSPQIKSGITCPIGAASSNPPTDTGAIVDRLARSSIAAFATYVVGAVLTYLSQLAIARSAGADSYGIYAYVLAWMTVLAYCSALGFDVSLLRFVPEYSAREAWPLLRGAIEYAQRWSMTAGVAILLAGSATV
jgi:O-antigen/teichoic acid export membrane protein